MKVEAMRSSRNTLMMVRNSIVIRYRNVGAPRSEQSHDLCLIGDIELLKGDFFELFLSANQEQIQGKSPTRGRRRTLACTSRVPEPIEALA